MDDRRAPKVSAIIATKDRLDMLRRAVAAIVEQAYDGVVETIVVMDGGPEPDDLQSHDPRRPIRIVPNKRKPGLPGARNTGILEAEGDLIAFCDDDDVWQSNKLSAQVALLSERPDVMLAVTGMTVVWNGRRIPRVWSADTLSLADFVRSRVQEVHPSSFVWRREAFEAIGLVDEELPGAYGEDWDLLIRIARCSDVGNVPCSLVDVHWHPGTFFMDKWAIIAQAIDYSLQKHPELTESRHGHALLLGRQSFAQAACGDRGPAFRTAVRSLRLWPGDRRAWTAIVVASGLISAERAQKLANSVGRGI